MESGSLLFADVAGRNSEFCVYLIEMGSFVSDFLLNYLRVVLINIENYAKI